MNINNSSFIAFLDNITKIIQKNINLNDYFMLTKEQKLNISYTVFSLIKTNSKVILTDNDFKTIISILLKKMEKEENYEFASVLNDIYKNYEVINNFINDKKNEIKVKKSEKT